MIYSDENYIKEINQLKKDRQAIILAHYYQDSEIQDIADFIGDSLQLSQAAQKAKAQVILFAGVHFMAETAKILNPHARVVIPDMSAGCSLADSCRADQLAAYRALHPEYVVVSYINCSAEVKALSDIICTSSNAEKIVRSIPENKPILFVPDRNLGAYVSKKTQRSMKLWPGVCIVHETFSERKLIKLMNEERDAVVLAHPECEAQILRHAHVIGSTSMLLQEVIKGKDNTFIVATEVGILHQMKKQAPHKKIIPAPPQGQCSCNECPYMKKNTLEKVYLALFNMSPEINLDEDIRTKALIPIERMLALST